MEWIGIIALFGSFAIFLALGVPISFAIGLSSVIALVAANMVFGTPLPVALDESTFTLAQRMASGLDSFPLLAIPFFILAGNIMNSGGIATRLIDFAKVLVGRMPGSLAHCNIASNMLFGAISGSAVASAAAVGGVMAPLQKKEGYEPAFSAAVNISSCPTGLLIPPSNTFIVYSLVSGGTSVGALFLAGYLPGIIMGLGLMLVAGIYAVRHNYPIAEKVTFNAAIQYTIRAIPSLLLIVLVMGGIITGKVTPTEASAAAVVYALFLSFVYKEIRIGDLPKIILESVITTSIVLLLIGTSMGMQFAMVMTDIPFIIANSLTSLSENKYVLLLIITFVLLLVGTFMDMTPALLIFTPIFLPIAQDLGMDPVHFGVFITFNLCIGICTPPVGSALFIGSSIAKVRLDEVIPKLLPFYAVLVVALLLVTYIPAISLALPRLFGMMG
ncbi:MAG: TRAP transporter large permease [Alphaproteobacteria bacterium]